MRITAILPAVRLKDLLLGKADAHNKPRRESKMDKGAWPDSINAQLSGPGPDCFVHVTGPDGELLNVLRRFLRVPVVGEYLIMDHGGPFFRVEAVLHVPFSEGGIGAELWCSRAPDEVQLLKDFNARC
jgi:hypothetical protein